MSTLVKGVKKGVKKIGKALKKGWKKLTSTKIGKIVGTAIIVAGAMYLGGLALGAMQGAGAGAGAGVGAGTGTAVGTGTGTGVGTGVGEVLTEEAGKEVLKKSGEGVISKALGAAEKFASSNTGQAAIAGGVQGAFTPDAIDLAREEKRIRDEEYRRRQSNLNVGGVSLRVPSPTPYVSGLIGRNMG